MREIEVNLTTEKYSLKNPWPEVSQVLGFTEFRQSSGLSTENTLLRFR